ncbi:MAG TPA: protein kinase [Polyangiaceae bacterium]|nr:protein kinase [Polyangiaceae bacterium]
MERSPCPSCGGHHAEAVPCPTVGRGRVGTTLDDKYEIARVLGVGGMGEVYEARHKQIRRRLAIKFLLPKYAAAPDIVARFENEARAAGSLEHENIAAVFDTGATPDGARYLVMEFLDGEDCASALARLGTFSVSRSAELAVQVTRGLGVAHGLGIVHRDLKPANLFLTRRADGTELVKILDFGIAKLRRLDLADGAPTTGPVFGTPHYMSPEQARGSPELDARTDVYALGVIVYELLSGKKPHGGTSALEIAFRVATEPPTLLGRLRPDLPGDLVAAVERAMARDADDRFQSMSELRAALLPFVHAADEGGTRSAAETPAHLRETRPSLETGVISGALGGRFSPPTTNAPISHPTRDAKRESSRTRLGPLAMVVAVVATLAGTWAWRLVEHRLGSGAEDPTSAAPVSGASIAPSAASPLQPQSPAPASAGAPPDGERRVSEQREERPDNRERHSVASARPVSNEHRWPAPEAASARPAVAPDDSAMRVAAVPSTSLVAPSPSNSGGSDDRAAAPTASIAVTPAPSVVSAPAAPKPADVEQHRLHVDPENPYP